MNNIYVNSIIEWCDEENNLLSLERVLWISPELDDVILIRIEKEVQLPFVRDYSDIMRALETPYVKRLSRDPYNHLSNVDEEYLNKHRKKRDKAWGIIKDLVELEPIIYSELERGV